MPWGELVDRSGLPGCPTGEELVVNDTTADLDGGDSAASMGDTGPTLSLREALWVARNRSGPQNVRFDAALFSTVEPPRIMLTEDSTMPAGLTDTCIDGRGRGVVIEWSIPPGSAAPSTVWTLGEGSLQVGLTLLSPPTEQIVASAQVAGCRYGTDGVTTAPSSRWLLESVGDAVIGPMNVFAGEQPIRTFGETTVFESYFGFDPSTGNRLPTGVGISLFGQLGRNEYGVEITDCVFVGTGVQWRATAGVREVRASIHDCYFEGSLGPEGASGMAVQAQRGARVGPNNDMRGLSLGVSVMEPGVTVTQNRISHTREVIAYPVSAPPPGPTIVALEGPVARGTCPVPGTVELFGGVVGEHTSLEFIGETSCDASTEWSIAGVTTTSAHLVATLTNEAGSTSLLSEPREVP